MKSTNASKVPAGRLLVGTSGFSYDAWKGAFYPPGLPAKQMLAYYAARFPSVEINYTFKSLPTEKAVATWCEQTPEGFVFAVKAHMRATHSKDPAAAQEALRLSLAALAPLGPRLGPVLLQFAAQQKYDPARLLPVLDRLPAGRRFVVEARNPTWTEALPLLRERGVAWCVVDADEEEAPKDALDEGAFHYVRLRKAEYSAKALAGWAKRIDAALRAGRDVHVYFKHEDEGAGPRFAQQLADAVARTRGGA